MILWPEKPENHPPPQKKINTEPSPNSKPDNAEAAAGKKKKAPSAKAVKVPDPVVGIGASAGGLEALEAFFKNTPSDCGIAFVLVQHLSATKKSIMGDLIKRYTKLEITQIKDKTKIKTNHIYIAPPDKDVAIMNGKLFLMESTVTHGLRLPIDYFFRSLAEDQAEKAICIILSGTGTDGTLGLKAVKGEGGMAMVQDTKSSKYDGMPRSAISTGLVDYVMAVEKMPKQLVKYVKHSFFKKTGKAQTFIPQATDYLDKIYILLRNQTGHDFSYYKKNTICRRIERRMAVHQIDKIENYVKYVQQNKQELETLFKDLLIGVTNFFRDPEAFTALKEKTIPALLKDKPASYTFRVWVPGCSTGEEAFSVAILFKELMEENRQNYNIQIFATDLDSEAVETARLGIFPDGIAADVSAERLNRYFVKENGTYSINKDIREMIVFAKQDLIKDPPFSKLDLVCCRNLLIYLGTEIQKKILPLFHYTLVQDGMLFLGSSESIGQFADLYRVIDKKWKIFLRKGAARSARPAPDFPILSLSEEDTFRNENKLDAKRGKINLHDLSEKILLNEYSPSCVVINGNFEILHFYGRTGKYLEPAPGDPRLNILEMAREGLKLPLNTAIRKVASGRKEVVCRQVRVRSNGDFNLVNVIVRHIQTPDSAEHLMLIVFEEIKSHKDIKPEPKKTGKEEDERIKQLETELQSNREYLQTTVEELETSNEELKSTNEELQSSNEELQSTNEELETSKEELQSVNEELTTVNNELENKIGELTQSNNDMNNLLSSTEIATIFLDTRLNIARFTPQTCSIIKLIQTDLGRYIGDLASNLNYTNLVQDSHDVLDNLETKAIDVNSKDGRTFNMRIMPYRTLDNVIEGVVITFVDISERVEFEALRRLAVVVKDSNDAITIQDLEGNITAWNKGAESMYGWTESEALKMNISDIVPEDKKEEALNMIKKVESDKLVTSFETERTTKGGETVLVWLVVTKLVDDAGKTIGIASTERDITDRREDFVSFKESETKYREQVKDLKKQIKAIQKK